MTADPEGPAEPAPPAPLPPLLPPVPADIPAPLHPLWHVLLRCFGHTPPPRQLAKWAEKLERGQDARGFPRQLAGSRQLRARPYVRTHHPPGHHSSPVVDPDQIGPNVAREHERGRAGLAGIELRLEEMAEFWRTAAPFLAATRFTPAPRPGHRYFVEGGSYPLGDAAVLRAMRGVFRPHRIVEAGSGFSTACMLDSAEEFALDPLRLDCVEPNPERLLRLLRPGDEARLTLHRRPLQEMPEEPFRALAAGDILFIDSSHVLKTGRDVHFALFHILPGLARGVLIHFHDCRFPFEYSDRQIFEKNFSWNEAYAVRALLMDSRRYRIRFWASLFVRERPDLVAAVFPDLAEQMGSALWLDVA